MSNLALELLLLTAFLVNFGAILTANVYSRTRRKLKQKQLFCGKSLINPYSITEEFTPLINIHNFP